MAPTVPLELQLLVIDLAIPPLTRKNLGAVRALMRRLPLVNRVWRSYVYDKIPAVPKLVLCEAEEDRQALERFKKVVEEVGRVVQHYELDLSRWTGTIIEGHNFESALRPFETAWVDLPFTQCPWLSRRFAGLSRLAIDDSLHAESPDLLIAGDVRLEHLTLGCVSLDDVDLRAPHVKTVALDRCYDIGLDRLLTGLPALEVLGVAASLDSDAVLAASGSFPSTLRHVLFSFEDDSFVQHELLTGVTFPSTLETLTIRHRADLCPSTTDSPSLLDIHLGYMREACARSGTLFTVIEAPEDDSAFDLEAWALLVGG